MTPSWLLRVAGVTGLPSSAALVDAAGQKVAVLLRPARRIPYRTGSTPSRTS